MGNSSKKLDELTLRDCDGCSPDEPVRCPGGDITLGVLTADGKV